MAGTTPPSADFEAATQYVAAASQSGSLDSDALLRLYGLFKQATAGTCNTQRPSFFDRRGRTKWDAWQGCRQLTSETAEQEYVALLSKLVPDWAGSSGAASNRSGAAGPVQSRMAGVPAVEEQQVCIGA
jgi:diazepam-binding inhibitor (GABA receptor modulating acyl-CoA-binding protein)